MSATGLSAEQIKVLELLNKRDYPTSIEEANEHNYQFWSTQPVPSLVTPITRDIKMQNLEEPLEEPLGLLEGYEWATLDISNNDECDKVTNFLNKQYDSKKNKKFRPFFSKNFIRWQLGSNGICLVVRVVTSGTIVGAILSTVNTLQLNKYQHNCPEVKHVCVHRKLRGKKLVTRLFRELTRRYRLQGFDKGFYGSNRYLPKPFFQSKQFSRAINPKILMNTGYLRPEKVTLEDLERVYYLPKKFILNKKAKEKFVRMEEEHCPQAYEKLCAYFKKFNVHPVWTYEEFKEHFMGHSHVYAYVMIWEEEVIDFVSFYVQPIQNFADESEKYPQIRVGHLYHYSATDETAYRMVSNALIAAKNHGIDVMKGLEVMEHGLNMQDHAFIEDNDLSFYYMWNWATPERNIIQMAKLCY